MRRETYILKKGGSINGSTDAGAVRDHPISDGARPAARVGFADLHGVTRYRCPRHHGAGGAAREIVGPLVDQPHRAYYDAYQAINVRLDAMAEAVPPCLRTHGYQATANTEEHLPTGAEDRLSLPPQGGGLPGRAGLDRKK